MGGRPLTALSIIGFPIETISPRVMTQMLRGGMDKMREAGVVIIGGHSINDQEPKFGYAVTGMVNPHRIIANNTAKPGDVLVLTKPLGVGIISFAGQMGRASEAALAAAAKSMTELNRAASEAMIEVGVSAATDVTGFGLLGHLGEMVQQSGVTAELWADQIPIFDEVLEYVSQAMISGGVERNIEHSSQIVSVEAGVSEEMTYVLYDPQTSGGMLISVPEQKAGALVSTLKERGVACAQIIGRIVGKSEGEIIVRNDATTSILSPVEGCGRTGTNQEETPMSDDTNCCGSGSGTAARPAELFSEFCGANLTDGAVSLRTKELMAISLSLVTKCEPCVRIHINKAKKMGITDAEIDECVMMAVMFGGAPVMMFYNTIMGKL
jgi:selenide,water dikinase